MIAPPDKQELMAGLAELEKRMREAGVAAVGSAEERPTAESAAPPLRAAIEPEPDGPRFDFSALDDELRASKAAPTPPSGKRPPASTPKAEPLRAEAAAPPAAVSRAKPPASGKPFRWVYAAAAIVILVGSLAGGVAYVKGVRNFSQAKTLAKGAVTKLFAKASMPKTEPVPAAPETAAPAAADTATAPSTDATAAQEPDFTSPSRPGDAAGPSMAATPEAAPPPAPDAPQAAALPAAPPAEIAPPPAQAVSPPAPVAAAPQPAATPEQPAAPKHAKSAAPEKKHAAEAKPKERAHHAAHDSKAAKPSKPKAAEAPAAAETPVAAEPDPAPRPAPPATDSGYISRAQQAVGSITGAVRGWVGMDKSQQQQ